ncbi:uncharacterized protein LOC122274548 [Carya illinoinensis]|uniref:uncharacterized protein LOC122274548 n=1 Tax=Carya illinoinensis TaxID=32201 RepID=UPI001C725450|nr:uncharacterized protein LOC122274548 [Carya illinoinensis]
MVDFSNLIFELGLMDIHLMGGEFTWSNNLTWSRLDRFLISPSWKLHDPNLSRKRLPRICSDHFPVMLDCGGIQGGNLSNILAYKLKALKKNLNIWNEQIFGDVTSQKKSLFQELQSLEGVGDENNRKDQVVSELERLTLMEEISWRQKSRALWLWEGDKCTKFFHQVANAHRRFYSIESMNIDGGASSDQVVIKEHVAGHFEHL